MYKDSERELRFPLAVAGLLPERRSRQARRGRSWLRGVWRYRSLSEAGRTPPQEAFRHRNDPSRTVRQVRGDDDARSVDAVCHHVGRGIAGEPVVGKHGTVVARPRRAGATCPRSSRSRRSVTGFVASWKRSYAAGGRSKRIRGWSARIRPRLTGSAHGLSVGGERQLSADTVEIRVTSSVQSGELELPRFTSGSSRDRPSNYTESDYLWRSGSTLGRSGSNESKTSNPTPSPTKSSPSPRARR